MAISRKTNQIYVSRDIDFVIEEYITNQTGKVLFVHGQGGVGKSTLLKKFLAYKAEEIPTVLINIQENNAQSFVDILLDEDMTTVKYCPNFEKIRAILLKEPKLLNAIISTDMDGVESKIGEYDQEWGEYAKIAIDGIKAGAKFLKSGEEKTKKEFLNNPEMVLLSALAEDFEQYGLFMVDTFEKIKNMNIKSKINFEDSGELSMRLREKNYRLKDYIEGLVYLLVENATFIIAGRNSEDELGMDIPTEYTEELSLEKFSKSNIKEFFTLHEKNHHLPMPNQKHLNKIEKLTNGSPLLIGLFPKIAKEYDSWDEFDYEEMQRRMNTDPDFGLLFYLTDRILTHIEGIEDIWKLVMPRVLSREIEKVLFEETKVLDSFVDAGLGFKGSGKENNRYYLHDEVHRAILNHAELEYGGGLASWHDNEKMIEVHKKLMAFYERRDDLYGVNAAFEVCYHKMMLRENFEKDFEVTREEFASLALGSISLNHDDKFRVCNGFDGLSDTQISELIKAWIQEKETWSSFMSQALYERLTEVLKEGQSNQITEDIPFLESLKDDKKLKKDWSLYYILGIAYGNKKAYDQAIASYQKAIAINPKEDKAYYNMGSAYYWLGEFEKVIASYIKALKINPNNSSAYLNLFELQLTQNQAFDQALEAQYIELFQKQKESFVQYEMLKIFQALASGQELSLERWEQEYREVSIGGWSFDELREWIDGVGDDEIKAKLLEALGVFEGHG